MRKELGMHYNIHYSKVNATFHGERTLLKRMVTQPGFEPGAYCLGVKLASSMVFSQLLPFVTFTRFWGVCFRSQRLRLARLRGEFSDGFLTVVAVTAMPYWLRSTLLQ